MRSWGQSHSNVDYAPLPVSQATKCPSVLDRPQKDSQQFNNDTFREIIGVILPKNSQTCKFSGTQPLHIFVHAYNYGNSHLMLTDDENIKFSH